MSNAQPEKMEDIVDAIESFNHAMLVTQRDGELRSRPMAIGDVTGDGRLRFITSDDSGKVSEIDEEHDVNVALQGEATFLSISGKARLTKDSRLIEKSWKRSQDSWFSEGRDDPHVMVLEVIPSYAEYWDRSGKGVVRSVLELARETLGKETVSQTSDDQHQKVDVSNAPIP